MAKKNIQDILDKIDRGNYTPEEEQAAKLWLFQLNQDRKLNLSDEKLGEVSDKMWSAIEKSQQDKSEKNRPPRLWPRIVAVAAAVALMVIGVYFFNSNRPPVNNDVNVVVQDVAPGQVGATLTLASGKKIRLTDAANGELAKEAGVTITKSEDGELTYEIKGISGEFNKINTLSTANGETYKLRLPDGSSVWLNAASSLTYSANLIENGQRRVKLQGEGYFEIFKDKKHPFIVSTDKQEVEVLGTHFNVMAYKDEPVAKTTLLEGSVKVSGENGQKILSPGQQAKLSHGNISVGKADLEEVVSWKNGEIILNGQDVQTIMRMISRWYNVEIDYEGEVSKELYYAKISRFDNISKLLNLLEKAQGIHFKIEGRKVIVTK